MAILKDQKHRLLWGYGLLDDSKKILKDLLGETKKKWKYARHQNVIETKEHRGKTLFKKTFLTRTFW